MKGIRKKKFFGIGLILILVLAVIFAGVYYFKVQSESKTPKTKGEITYDIFVGLVNRNVIEKAWIETKEDYQKITVKLKQGETVFPLNKTAALNQNLVQWLENHGAQVVVSDLPNSSDQIVTVKFDEPQFHHVYSPYLNYDFLNWLMRSDVTPVIVPKFNWRNVLLFAILPVLIIGAIFIWLFWKGPLQGLGKEFTKSRAKGKEELKKKYSFADVAGVDEAKEEVSEVISFLRKPEHFKLLSAKMPHGVLLYGPPGTGKSLLAKAAAYEAGIPYREASGSDFHEMFVGVGAARWRDLFEWAKKNAPATLILDEIDSAVPKRVQGAFNNEGSSLTNAMLHGLSIIEHEDIAIILFAITNRPDMLDPALLRPGRLDRHIEIPLPDNKGREAILKVHLERPRLRPIDPNFDPYQVVKETRGFSGADIATLVNEAAIRAARRVKGLKEGEKIAINQEDFREAILRVLMGPRKKLKYRPIEKEILAWHEAGHVLAAKSLPETDEVQFVTILPRGRAAGFTRLLPSDDYHIYTQTQIFSQIKVFLAGRAAEIVHFNGKVSTGAQSDLEIANSITRNAVCVYGMSKLGPIYIPQTTMNSFWGSPVWQGETGKLAEIEIKEILGVEEKEIVNLLRAKQNKLEALARKLLEKPFITSEEIDEIIGNA